LKHYAVIGHPISHSRSPEIHQAFAAQFNQTIDFQRLDCLPESFADTVHDFFQANGGGMSVTVPHKTTAYLLCAHRSSAAQAAEAVNALYVNSKGELCGDNTDGRGLLNDLVFNHHLNLNDRHILVIGAGGATCGLIQPFIQAGIASLTIANRTVERAQMLAAKWSPHFQISAIGLNDPAPHTPDVIIHASSGGLSGEAVTGPTQWYSPRVIAIDISYGRGPTPFLRVAKEFGVQQCIDGLGMLVEQAALAFQIWRNQSPETLPVIQQLREALLNT